MSPLITTLAGGSSRGFGKNMGVKTAGRKYAEGYLSAYGGSLIELDTPGDFSSTLDAASPGDAILFVEPGTYTSQATAGDAYNSCPWRKKQVLICGDTNDANEMVWGLNHAGQRGKHLWTGGYSEASQYPNQKRCAYVHIKRYATSSTNYINALAGMVTNINMYGIMRNCIFDSQGGGISWIYDNNGRFANQVYVQYCTFFNYGGAWYNSYSGYNQAMRV